MGEILGPNGKRLRPKPDQNQRHQVLMNEAMLNLVARVQNLESVIIMLATLAQKNMTVADSAELDIVMEAFWQAQTQRGASHLAREDSDDNPAIFV